MASKSLASALLRAFGETLSNDVPAYLQQGADLSNQETIYNMNRQMSSRDAMAKQAADKFWMDLAMKKFNAEQEPKQPEPPKLPSGEAGTLQWLKENEPNQYQNYLNALIRKKGGDDKDTPKTNYVKESYKGAAEYNKANNPSPTEIALMNKDGVPLPAPDSTTAADYFLQQLSSMAQTQGLNKDSILANIQGQQWPPQVVKPAQGKASYRRDYEQIPGATKDVLGDLTPDEQAELEALRKKYGRR